MAVSAFVEVIAYHGVSGGFSRPSFVCVEGGVAGFKVLNIGGGPVLGLGEGDVVCWGVG